MTCAKSSFLNGMFVSLALLPALHVAAKDFAPTTLVFERGDFSGPGRVGFFTLPADGGEAQPLGWFPQFQSVGSPAYSPDGKRFAFDAVPPNQDISGTQIVVCDADGSHADILGDGLMPTWSADGKQIACSRYAQGNSAWTYDLATRKATLVETDAWGVQWSPDGKYQAFSRNGSLVVRSVAAGQIYEYSFAAQTGGGWQYNFTWSPDGSRICGFVELEIGQKSILIMTLNLPPEPVARGPVRKMPAEVQLVVATKEEDESYDVAWHPTKPRVVLSRHLSAIDRNQLWEFNPETGSLPFPMPGQSTTANYSHCWSPDGKTLLYVGVCPQ